MAEPARPTNKRAASGESKRADRVGMSGASRSVSRSAKSGRYVTKSEARAAAKTKVTVDQKLGKMTPDWVEALAEGIKRSRP